MKKLYCFFIILHLICMNTIHSTEDTLPYPYNSIEILPNNAWGWYANGYAIQNLFAQKKPKVVIEVGCWLGVSTMHMASLLPKEGIVYAVDHWLGSEEHQPGQAFWNPILPQLYQQFLSNVIHAKLYNKIIPLRMNSIEASQHLSDIKADLIYLDASHDYESVYADLNVWYPLVKGHGILCGDDFPHPPIQQALNQFASEQGLQVVYVKNSALWYLVEQSSSP